MFMIQRKDGGTDYIYVVEISRYVTKKQRESIEKH